jgi:signal transduction histidine kinase
VTGVANVALAAIVSPIGVPLGPAAALYLLAASRDATSPSIRCITTTAVSLLVAYLVAAAYVVDAFPAFELLHAGLLWAVAWFAGERSRLRREQVADLVRDAERERLLAAAEERARIARDLHDSAGHAINVIAVRAGAARLRYPGDPEQGLDALRSIEDLARRTAEEIDHFVGALRDPTLTDAVEAPPGLASVPTLVDQHAGAGLAVTCTTTGASPPLASAVDQAAYRILQEALTNASRHGSGSAQLAIAFGDAALELRVTNRIATDRASASPNGHGLVGMRERAALLGGHLDAEPRDGIFCVCARLPYQPGPS